MRNGPHANAGKIQVWNGTQYLKKEFTVTLRTTLNWEGPGRDQIANFWLKKLMATHKS
jgi:hypothetical protein